MGKYIGKKVIWAIICIIVLTLLITGLIIFTGRNDPASILLEKPVIYLYPESETDVQVWLNLDGQLGFTYPAYDDGWYVTAYPDGTLINHNDGNEYNCLFWEGSSSVDAITSTGFIVAGCDTVDFLRDKLEFMGLIPKEYNEFIIYWAPKMHSNAYNLITFQNNAYTDTAELIIIPSPDSILRIFMTFTPLEKPIIIPEQQLETFERAGFTVVEWGGAELNR